MFNTDFAPNLQYHKQSKIIYTSSGLLRRVGLNVFLKAQEFSVAFLAPSAQSVILGDNWSSQARNRFITLVHGRSFIVTLYSIVHGVMRVHVHISMEMGDVSVADLLVQEGHARLAPESFESKVTQRETAKHITDLSVDLATPKEAKEWY